jgi:Cyclic phosphodiesterase-like protein.
MPRLPLDMTKKPRAVAYWLLPETAAREALAEKIRELAMRLEAPVFAPHVTFLSRRKFAPSGRILPELGTVTIELTIHSIRVSEQFTKTLFVQFERSGPLQELGDRIWKASGAPDRYVIDPHLSLLYASLAEEKKKALVDEIKFPFREVRFSSICAVRCARSTATAAEVEQWRLLAP